LYVWNLIFFIFLIMKQLLFFIMVYTTSLHFNGVDERILEFLLSCLMRCVG